jgi:hypothetical protein
MMNDSHGPNFYEYSSEFAFNVQFIKKNKVDILGDLYFSLIIFQYQLLVNHHYNSQSFELYIINSAQLDNEYMSIMSLTIAD